MGRSSRSGAGSRSSSSSRRPRETVHLPKVGRIHSLLDAHTVIATHRPLILSILRQRLGARSLVSPEHLYEEFLSPLSERARAFDPKKSSFPTYLRELTLGLFRDRGRYLHWGRGPRVWSLDKMFGKRRDSNSRRYHGREPEDRTTSQMMERLEAREIWQQILGRLTPKERRVLFLLYWERLSQADAAKLLGIGEPRVSKIHSRVLQRIRSYLEPKL